MHGTSLNGPGNPLEYVMNKRDETIVQTVQRAMDSKNMLLAYQPIMHTKNPTRPAFYEGLIRVLDDNGEVIPAAEFITQCETLEVGRRIDTIALELGLQALFETPTLRLSINMSARSIGYPKWMDILNKGMARDATVAERLILEITESSAMLMPDIVTVFMSDLRARGISFALDDFGAGYTAFRFFKDFQFDIVKIDGQFTRNIHNDPDNQVLTAALVDIARHFDMFTVSEMVETAAELEYLQSTGVDCVQGYFTGRPDTVPEWKRDNTRFENFG
jgi:EAL domain-containing protein (putative c-di-GMP-specific phosphodiesterase class I)